MPSRTNNALGHTVRVWQNNVLLRETLVIKLEEYYAYYHCTVPQPIPFDVLCLLASRTKQKINQQYIIY